MKIVAGVDIGNSTTEICIGKYEGDQLTFLASASTATTGTKGTLENVRGISTVLAMAKEMAGDPNLPVDEILLNEAAPVIGDTAMETITETIIMESSMIGHNPGTPAGAGQAVGVLIQADHLDRAERGKDYLVTVPGYFSYEATADLFNRLSGVISIVGAILQKDEAVLVYNRLEHKIPILDEVKQIDRLLEGKLAAIEVAYPGQSVRMLSNPYGIATLLDLSAEETRKVLPIAKSLMGKRSAVVIKTPGGDVKENILPAGEIYIKGTHPQQVKIDEGAQKIMEAVEKAGDVSDITGEEKSNIGNMFAKIRRNMDTLKEDGTVRITDILAVDTLAPVQVSGALAGETCLEKAVGVAAMVKTSRLPMQEIAQKLNEMLHIPVRVAGVEAVMASLGAMTTPGTTVPLAMLDMGGGSTDAALVTSDGKNYITHQAGAGELVTLLIQTELGLGSRSTAEQIKRYPLAKVESLHHIRLESGEMKFFDEPIPAKYFGSVVLLLPNEMVRIEEDLTMERIVDVRREAKKKVFVTNAIRALIKVAPDHNLRNIPNVVLVGGSAEDFEIPEMLMEAFSEYKVLCGRGNIRKTQGPRNAVATGLVMSVWGNESV